jgi:hypothetical protein
LKWILFSIWDGKPKDLLLKEFMPYESLRKTLAKER